MGNMGKEKMGDGEKETWGKQRCGKRDGKKRMEKVVKIGMWKMGIGKMGIGKNTQQLSSEPTCAASPCSAPCPFLSGPHLAGGWARLRSVHAAVWHPVQLSASTPFLPVQRA